MTIIELEQYLINNRIPLDMYNLDGGLPSEAYCISNLGDCWEVYYSERGVKTQLMKFRLESDACLYFQTLIDKVRNEV